MIGESSTPAVGTSGGIKLIGASSIPKLGVFAPVGIAAVMSSVCGTLTKLRSAVGGTRAIRFRMGFSVGGIRKPGDKVGGTRTVAIGAVGGTRIADNGDSVGGTRNPGAWVGGTLITITGDSVGGTRRSGCWVGGTRRVGLVVGGTLSDGFRVGEAGTDYKKKN